MDFRDGGVQRRRRGNTVRGAISRSENRTSYFPQNSGSPRSVWETRTGASRPCGQAATGLRRACGAGPSAVGAPVGLKRPVEATGSGLGRLSGRPVSTGRKTTLLSVSDRTCGQPSVTGPNSRCRGLSRHPVDNGTSGQPTPGVCSSEGRLEGRDRQLRAEDQPHVGRRPASSAGGWGCGMFVVSRDPRGPPCPPTCPVPALRAELTAAPSAACARGELPTR